MKGSPVSKKEHLKAITKRIQSLPTLPPVVRRLTTMVESPDVTAKDVASSILDSLKRQRCSSSSTHRSTVFLERYHHKHAIILLGSTSQGVVPSPRLRSHGGVQTGSGSTPGHGRHLGTIAGPWGSGARGDLQRGLLLHDIGKVLVRASLERTTTDQRSVCGEKYYFRKRAGGHRGGSRRDRSWCSRSGGLPERLTIPITFPHDPDEGDQAQGPVAVVHIADSLCRALRRGQRG